MEKKNTRTSMVAAVTSLPRVRFFIFHYESGLVLKIVFDNFVLVRISPVFFVFFSIPHPRSSPFSLRVQNGKTALMCASDNGHTYREAPPINRRRQVGWWQIERQIKSARAYNDS